MPPKSLRQKHADCVRCPYYTHPFVPSVGKRSAKIFFISESPWTAEVDANEPLSGRSGQRFTRMLTMAEMRRPDVYITNVLKCKPTALDEDYNEEALELCKSLFLQKEIHYVQPTVIVPMGNVALKAITNKTGITKARGVTSYINFFKKKELVLRTKLFPTFNPAYIDKNPGLERLVISDFKNIRLQSTQDEIIKSDKVKYRQLISKEQTVSFLKFCLSDKVKRLSWDIETTSLDYRTADILCFSFSIKERSAYVLVFRYPYPAKIEWAFDPEILYLLFRLLYSKKLLYFHNGKFDLRMMRRFFQMHIDKILDVHKVNWQDTMNMHFVYDENLPKNLKDVCRLHTDIIYTKEELDGVKKGLLIDMPLEKLIGYAAKDADGTLRIGSYLSILLKEQNLFQQIAGFDWSDMEVCKAFFDIETFGCPIDIKEFDSIDVNITRKIDKLKMRLQKLADDTEFNPRSSQQLCKVMFDRLRLPQSSIVTKKGAPSTDKYAIEEIMSLHPHKFLSVLKLHRQYSTIKSTFVDGLRKRLDENNRLHPDFLVAGAVTGRVQAKEPNVVNIPRDKEFEEGVLVSIRKAFKARPGWQIITADWSQIEFKIIALLAGDTRLIHELFILGQDMHMLSARALYPKVVKIEKRIEQLTQDAVFPDVAIQVEKLKVGLKDFRTDSKAYNFGLVYGGQDENLAANMGIDLETMRTLSARMRQTYPDLARYIEFMPQIAWNEGQVDQPFGRIRRFPAVYDRRTKSEQGRQAINFGPQSSAAFVGRGALVRIVKRLKHEKLQAFPFNLVYDMILSESPDDEVSRVKRIMVEEMTEPIPELGNYSFSIDVGVGDNWQEADLNAQKVTGIGDV